MTSNDPDENGLEWRQAITLIGALASIFSFLLGLLGLSGQVIEIGWEASFVIMILGGMGCLMLLFYFITRDMQHARENWRF